MVEMKQCKECELYFTQQFNYCPICGHNLTFMEKEQEEEKKEEIPSIPEGTLVDNPPITMRFTPEERERVERILEMTPVVVNLVDDGDPGHEIEPF